MKYSLAAFLIVLVSTGAAHAFPNVCSLESVALPAAAKISGSDVVAYSGKLKAECELSRRFEELSGKARAFSISPEQITLYQAIRYVQRHFYDQSKRTNTPIQVTYQIWKTDYEKPVSQRSSAIWDNWMKGLQQFGAFRAEILDGGTIGLSDLLRIHRGFYQVSDEDGDFAHNPEPGRLKIGHSTDEPWWSFKTTEETMKAHATVDEINATYRQMGLDVPEGDVFSVNLNTQSIYSANSRSIPGHVRNFLKFLNGMIAQAQQGQHMVWSKRLMTPGEVAYFAQQYLAQVHPFYEGNGRMSRFVQEVVLTAFGLPHGSSGDLMDDDILTNHADYYRLAIEKNRSLLTDVERCLDSVYPKLTGGAGGDINQLDTSDIEYDCRILK